jgi:hypothetical protein
MTSNINYAGINENFPIAGQDNDTQTFRDNFNTIKQNFLDAYDEITSLQANTAKTNADNDFAGAKIRNAFLQNNREYVHNAGTVGSEFTVDGIANIDFLNGHYQIYKFDASVNVTFLNFPTVGCGKVTLELYGDGVANRVITLIAQGGTTFKRSVVTTSTNSTVSFPNPITLTSSSNPVIIEVWTNNANTIFLNYVGTFA